MKIIQLITDVMIQIFLVNSCNIPILDKIPMPIAVGSCNTLELLKFGQSQTGTSTQEDIILWLKSSLKLEQHSQERISERVPLGD